MSLGTAKLVKLELEVARTSPKFFRDGDLRKLATAKIQSVSRGCQYVCMAWAPINGAREAHEP